MTLYCSSHDFKHENTDNFVFIVLADFMFLQTQTNPPIMLHNFASQVNAFCCNCYITLLKLIKNEQRYVSQWLNEKYTVSTQILYLVCTNINIWYIAFGIFCSWV